MKCKTCGKEFQPTQLNNVHCQDHLWGKHRPGYKFPLTRNCITCGHEFLIEDHHQGKRKQCYTCYPAFGGKVKMVESDLPDQ